MNILLIYPKYPDTFWSFNHILRLISKKAAFPPLGLLTIASMLPTEWNKKLVDLNVRELKDKDIIDADMVFISAMLVQKNDIKAVIKKCKEFGKTIVAGGPAFSNEYHKYKEVDHFVLNEAEVTLPMFLKDLDEGNLKKVYSSKERPDISKTPIPLWSILKLKHYATMSVQYSRGCPYNCEFCDIVIMNGRKPRTKSNEQMIAEFQAIYDAGWRGPVFVVDDNFIGNKVKVKDMLLSLIKWQKKNKYPFTLFTEASVNLAEDRHLMRLMSAANFNKVFLGIESTSLESLKECSKYQNVNINLAEAVKTIHNFGIQVMGGFIVGFDSDTENIFEAQIKFIQEVGIVTAMVGMLGVIPQTRLWYRLKDEGRLLKGSTGENTDGHLNFIPKMGEINLIEGYKKIISTIYSSKNYYKRINIFLKTFKPKFKNKMSFSDIKIFLNCSWRIGILSRSSLRYWRLVIKTFFTKKRAFPVAVELAIQGLHFQKVTKKVLKV